MVSSKPRPHFNPRKDPVPILQDTIHQKIFTQELEGTRRRGRPRKGWKAEVERDLQVLGVRRWRELVADRKKWKDIDRKSVV